MAEARSPSAILDGEVAVPDERGVTHIDHLSAVRGMRLSNSLSMHSICSGEDFRRQMLSERKVRNSPRC